MLCKHCNHKFDLGSTGKVICPNCSAELDVQIEVLTTNVPEYKKYVYFHKVCFVTAFILLAASIIAGQEKLGAVSAVFVVCLSFFVSAFFGGFMPTMFGAILRSKRALLLPLLTGILFVVLIFLGVVLINEI